MFNIVIDKIYTRHDPGRNHPENPGRIEAVYEELSGYEYANIVNRVKPRKAERDQILLVHSPEYYQLIEQTSNVKYFSIDPDTKTNEHSFETALYAAGGVITGIDISIKDKNGPVFALVRPPGHHAEQDRGMGFCLFNNVSIGAKYAIINYNIERVAIFDWDLHHGNGTQKIFYSDDRVLYISIHQYPYYPGTGYFNEIGIEDGLGYSVNIPYQAGAIDGDYAYAFERVVQPLIVEYEPQLILVSAGFDAYYKDPLGGMKLTHLIFGWMANRLIKLSINLNAYFPIFVLGGGYSYEGLKSCIREIVLSHGLGKNNKYNFNPPGEVYMEAVSTVRKIHSKYWSSF